MAAAAVMCLLAGCASDPPPADPPAAPQIAEPDLPPPAYPLTPDQHRVGVVSNYVVRQGDTLLDVARTYDLGYTQLITANRGIDPWVPKVDRKVVLPAAYLLPEVPRHGIVINLSQQRLFYFPPGGGEVQTFPIGVGIQGKKTPLGVTRVVAKHVHPAWYPPPDIRAEEHVPAVVPPGPDNPLGDYAMSLGWPGYLIHGTNKPYGVGRNVSHGCIRLYPEDIQKLFGEVKIGTPVRVVDQQAIAEWVGGTLYLAVFPDKDQSEQLDVGEPVGDDAPPGLDRLVRKVAAGAAGLVDWQAVAEAGKARSGIPVRITNSEPLPGGPAS